MQNLTAHLAKTPITWGEIQIGNILDGYMITEVEYSTDETEVRAYIYQGGGWSDWRPVTRPVSVWR
jgi:hypothetical protein